MLDYSRHLRSKMRGLVNRYIIMITRAFDFIFSTDCVEARVDLDLVLVCDELVVFAVYERSLAYTAPERRFGSRHNHLASHSPISLWMYLSHFCLVSSTQVSSDML